MAKYSKADLICLHNILAKKKGLPELDYQCKLAIPEICDKIEEVNKYVKPAPGEEKKHQYTTVAEKWSVVWILDLMASPFKLFKKPPLTTP